MDKRIHLFVFLCMAIEHNGEASLFLYQLEAIHLYGRTAYCRTVTGKLTEFMASKRASTVHKIYLLSMS